LIRDVAYKVLHNSYHALLYVYLEEVYKNNLCIGSNTDFSKVFEIYMNELSKQNTLISQGNDGFLITVNDGCSLQRAEFENRAKLNFCNTILPKEWHKMFEYNLQKLVIKLCENEYGKDNIPCKEEVIQHINYLHNTCGIKTALSSIEAENEGPAKPSLLISYDSVSKNYILQKHGSEEILVIKYPNNIIDCDEDTHLASQLYPEHGDITYLPQINSYYSPVDKALDIHCKATYPSPTTKGYKECIRIESVNEIMSNNNLKVHQDCRVDRVDNTSLICQIKPFDDTNQSPSESSDSNLRWINFGKTLLLVAGATATTYGIHMMSNKKDQPNNVTVYNNDGDDPHDWGSGSPKPFIKHTGIKSHLVSGLKIAGLLIGGSAIVISTRKASMGKFHPSSKIGTSSLPESLIDTIPDTLKGFKTLDFGKSLEHKYSLDLLDTSAESYHDHAQNFDSGEFFIETPKWDIYWHCN
jgi:hypothetical protein